MRDARITTAFVSPHSFINIDPHQSFVRGKDVNSMKPKKAGELSLVGFAGDVVTATVTGGIGDVIAQFAEATPNKSIRDDSFSLDLRRTGSYAAFSGLYSGAFQHLWFSKLHSAIPDPTFQLIINQGLMIPLLYYPLLLWLVPKWRGRTLREKQKLRKGIDIKSMIPKNWAFWVPLQFVQFRYIPTAFQVAYCSFWGLVWKVVLSLLTSGGGFSLQRKQLVEIVEAEEVATPSATKETPVAVQS